jgi:plastocyanin
MKLFRAQNSKEDEFMVKKFVALFPLVLLMSLLAGCVVQSAPTGSGGNTVTMGPNNYITGNTITLKKGQTITFVDDKATGSMHILVIGTDGTAKADPKAPDFGANGITFQPGDSKASPPWMNPGTYHVTCTIHPTTMNLTVTVTA